MDSLTQAVLGAGIQGAMLGRHQGRKALAAGALLATLPDLDVLIDYGDPVSGMINHRGFSHSVFVLTALALALTALFRYWRPSPHYSARRLFLTLWLVLITHPLLDAFTSYGTQLWWPLRPTPTSWSSIFIIDPFFTLPLFATVAAAAIVGLPRKARGALCWTLGWCAAYLALSVGAKSAVEAKARQDMDRDGIAVSAMFSTPEPFNIVLWRVVAKADDDSYIETVRSVFDTGPSESIRRPLNTALADLLPESSRLAGLRWFTDNWLRYDDIDGRLVVSDLRMGLGGGYYSFRFEMARRTGPEGRWAAISPVYWPGQRGTEHLSAVLRRAWQSTPPLPLAQWERNMTQPPAPAALP
ncbi:metal-dependent hydrolase [Pollutimonas sp. M17]|uniref:metal-dependent hydrolase n=1 Tax=Pollutimonas sp. M17 TaxID=2962065 RepID=UPI0021F3FAED|nr:metal-dependent hydrolase [Pollutimonas sp. M17]UYO94319.1 metal-dependent hydrolase [Pollutimonas sp. M17]